MNTKLISVCCLLAAVTSAQAQESRTFAELSAGVATQAPQYDVRSGVGPTAAFAIGRELREQQLSLEARVSASNFGAPTQIISPGGCFTTAPCVYASVSNVRVITFGVAGEYHAALRPITPIILFGLGARHVSEAPERESDKRPYAEVGAGVTFHHWGLRARYQATTAGSELPKWLIPVTLDYRF